MHLMSITLENLRFKGHNISDEEFEAAQLAILLHDVGHGPFSHTLEFSLLQGIRHEEISRMIINRLNEEFDGKLTLAQKIFDGRYERHFFHELVASQLDIDRLDYLMRDSFFTGVSEGTIGADRIIKMLDVVDDQIVVEEKGIYSIENFLSARRLMYWQVYLHKTSVGAEKMLIELIRRARKLNQQGVVVQATPQFSFFLKQDISHEDFINDPSIIDTFSILDDTDVWASIKYWLNHEDSVLQLLSRMILERRLFKIRLANEKIEKTEVTQLRKQVAATFRLSTSEAKYFVGQGDVSNSAYIVEGKTIKVLTKKGELVDVAQATDLPNIKAMSKIVKKHYLCWPKNITL